MPIALLLCSAGDVELSNQKAAVMRVGSAQKMSKEFVSSIVGAVVYSGILLAGWHFFGEKGYAFFYGCGVQTIAFSVSKSVEKGVSVFQDDNLD